MERKALPIVTRYFGPKDLFPAAGRNGQESGLITIWVAGDVEKQVLDAYFHEAYGSDDY